MKLLKAVSILCFLLCLQIEIAQANGSHTVRGVVITADGTVVPEFSVVIRHTLNKPELVQRKHFKNGEFTIDNLNADKVQLQITAPHLIGTRLEFDFKTGGRPTDYCIVILHNYRNEA